MKPFNKTALFFNAAIAFASCAQYELTPHAPSLPDAECSQIQKHLDELKCEIQFESACKDRLFFGAKVPTACMMQAADCVTAMNCAYKL